MTTDLSTPLTNEESYIQRRELFKNIWVTALHVDEKEDCLTKPKVIKTLKMDDIDRSPVGKSKRQRIKNLRHVCKRILHFCNQQEAKDNKILGLTEQDCKYYKIPSGRDTAAPLRRSFPCRKRSPVMKNKQLQSGIKFPDIGNDGNTLLPVKRARRRSIRLKKRLKSKSPARRRRAAERAKLPMLVTATAIVDNSPTAYKYTSEPAKFNPDSSPDPSPSSSTRRKSRSINQKTIRFKRSNETIEATETQALEIRKNRRRRVSHGRKRKRHALAFPWSNKVYPCNLLPTDLEQNTG